MNDQNLVIKEIFALAFQNYKKNNLKNAQKLYNQILNKEPNHFGSIFYLGSISLQNKNFVKAKQLFEKAVKIQPTYANAHHNLGQAQQGLGASHEAMCCYQKAIKIQPNLIASHNNLGMIQKELGQNNEAVRSFQKVIKIQPDLMIAHNNLGTVYIEMKKRKKAIKCFKKAIEINNKFSMAHYNLGKAFRELYNYKEAIKCFETANTTRSRAELLESTYFSNGQKIYPKTLKKLTSEDPLNLRVATMAAYVSKKEKINNTYPFCRNPLDYVYIKNLKNEISSPDKFSANLSKILGKVDFIWEPTTKTTTRGYHTSGNLFNKTDYEIMQLQELIKKQISIYRKHYEFSKDYFITKWPKKNQLEAWHVKLMKKGYQKPHIHPAGWLSGCFYLKIPKRLKRNQGAIKFGFVGYDYPFDKKLPNLIHVPKIFDIALFPSSLFHETIPFNSQEERHVIAFDLMPK